MLAVNLREQVRPSARCGVAARRGSFVNHIHHRGAAATDAHYPHHFRNRRRSGRQRLVASLPRPGGNTTGFTNIEGSIAGKWLEWLKQIAPRVNRVALLFNPATAPYAEIYLGSFGAAAAALAVEAIAMSVGDTSELESAVGGFMVIPDPFMSNRSAQITSLTARHRLRRCLPRPMS